MPDLRPIPPADLLIDAENPRLIQANTGQRDAQREIAQHQGKKLVTLAQDILDNGLNPSELPIVTPLKKDELKRYTVLEGNRRLTALKALENPEWLVGAVDGGVVENMRTLSKQYHKKPIESVMCFVVKDREDAQHWITLRHTGENDGAGVVRWGSDEAARFSARFKGLEIHSQALNFLESKGHLTPQQRSKIPAASYKRLLGTPEVREKIGISLVNGNMHLLGDEKSVAAALLHIASDLSNGHIKTDDIYTRDKRMSYANNLPAHVVVKPIQPPGQGSLAASKARGVIQRRRAKLKARTARDFLIPRDCILSIGDNRIAQIEDELRRLDLNSFTNAVSVLSRVFLELSVDSYIKSRALTIPQSAKLRAKLQDVVNDLVTRTKLTQQQARPLRTALQKDSFLAPSLDLMNDYVHSSGVFPAPSDLRANWDTLQPFFVAVWSA